jgi:hypothetical protein
MSMALQHEEADIPGLVDLYAKIDRMRILSSAQVVETAERIARKILDSYLEPDKSFIELREMVDSGSVNLIRDSVRPVAQNSRRCELRDVARECALTGSYVCFWHKADIVFTTRSLRFALRQTQGLAASLRVTVTHLVVTGGPPPHDGCGSASALSIDK